MSHGASGIQHLARLMGRARALEVMLSADDYDAALAERYGWINRALPASQLGAFVSSIAHRIAGLPAAGHVVVEGKRAPSVQAFSPIPKHAEARNAAAARTCFQAVHVAR